MRKFTTIFAILGCLFLLGISASSAQTGSRCDPQSGNCYNWYRDSSGNTHVQGHNLNTGSTWNQTIDRQGNQRGMDSRGNPWSYDSNTKTYMNYGTGRTCIGTGYARTCY